jgi:hypothetical protein
MNSHYIHRKLDTVFEKLAVNLTNEKKYSLILFLLFDSLLSQIYARRCTKQTFDIVSDNDALLFF